MCFVQNDKTARSEKMSQNVSGQMQIAFFLDAISPGVFLPSLPDDCG